MHDGGLPALLAGRHGHFAMESGYHSEWWFDLNRLFDAPERLGPFVAELAHRLSRHRIDAVCGPATGGARLAALIAAELRIESFHTERHEGAASGTLWPVNYLLPTTDRDRVRGRTIAIVDDAISAGSAVRGTLRSLIACGARPVALGALIVFGEGAERCAHEQSLALEAIARLPFAMWRPEECPLCRSAVAVERVSDSPQAPQTKGRP